MNPESTNGTFDGMMKPCPRCEKAKRFLDEVNRQLNGFILIGTRPDKDGDCRLNEPDVPTFGPWRLECSDCLGSGVVLTMRGKRTIALMQRWQGMVDPYWAKITDQDIRQEEAIGF